MRLLPAAELEEDFARYGPEPLEPSFDDAALEAVLARGGQLHTLLRDQRALVGIGRAYANEILHAAQLGAVRARPTGSRPRSARACSRRSAARSPTASSASGRAARA